jgi:hypothetical protein
VAFAIAMVAGEGLITALGYPTDGDAVAPLGIALLVSWPLIVVAMMPAAMAVIFGRRALRQGHRSGRLAMILGGIALTYWIVSTVLALADRALS